MRHAAGLVISRGVPPDQARLARAALVSLATLVIAVASVAAVEPVIDARPELIRVASWEDRVASDYTTPSANSRWAACRPQHSPR